MLSDQLTRTLRDGLAALDNQRLVLAIHDSSFPSAPDEDLGRGSPYSLGGRALLRFAASLGFGGVQLGPQGETTLIDPSPYDGALLSKSPLSIALATLREDPAWSPLCEGLLEPMVAARPAGPPERAQYAHAWNAARTILTTLHQRFRSAGGTHGNTDRGNDSGADSLAARFAAFRRHRGASLQPDADFAALTAQHGTDDWRRWPGTDAGSVDQELHCPAPAQAAAAARRRAELAQQSAVEIERHLFGQFILDQQHQELRRTTAAAGLALFGDLQIGFSHRDVWSRRALFRADYLMGAPPSRTNPDGQPWGYPVLDPEQLFTAAGVPGPAMQLLTARVDRLLSDFDGLRIDHPHGLVCPWVYAAADPDPSAAVPRGARLLCSPRLSDHPRLAALAIPTPDQLSRDPGIARYADDWVRELRPEQIDRYGRLFDAIMARVAATGRRQSDVVCEVLSTWPFPLRAVMDRYDLGRFCVTQKADLTRGDDVYRSENATARDWIMVGNHDTRPIWRVAEAWHGTAAGAARADHLARRLMPRPALRERFARWLTADGRHLCQAMFAELFASRAQRVSIFFADLFGLREIYNCPGLVDPDNWTLRLPADFSRLYQERVQKSGACNLPLALALALIARGAAPHLETTRRLIGAARQLAPSLDGDLVAILELALS